MQVRATTNGKFGSCGCGRSASGNCDGSHSLTEEQWAKILESRELDNLLEDKNRGSDMDEV